MTPMLLLAAALSLLIGVVIGLLGGGGSVLSVPMLIYAIGLEKKEAIATSLLMVGLTSVVAAIQHARARNVSWRTAALFGPASSAGAFAGGWVARFVPADVLLVVFALLMLGTASGMWRGRAPGVAEPPPPLTPGRVAFLLLLGLLTGALTGLVGAGGGFIVVPALTLFAALPVRLAVGTSLAVIAFNGLAGFAGYASHVRVDLALASVITASAIAGALGGVALSARVSPVGLRRGFAVVVVLVAAFLLVQQLR